MEDDYAELDPKDLAKFAVEKLTPVRLTKRQSSEHLDNAERLPRASLELPTALSRHQLAAGLRLCLRCEKQFQVNPLTGHYEPSDQCRFHPGTVVDDGARGVKVYSCCDRISNPYTEKQGCLYGAFHIHDCTLFEASEYSETENICGLAHLTHGHGVLAIGVSPLFTTNGVECGRIVIIDHNFEIVFDVKIRPRFRVTDYNSPCTNICEAHLEQKGELLEFKEVAKTLRRSLSEQTVFILGSRWKVAKQFLEEIGMCHPLKLHVAEKSDYQLNRYVYRTLSSCTALGEAVTAMHNLLQGHRISTLP